MSLADVAAATRLRQTIIERIEADQFAELDEPIFVRAHIKAIAIAVGEDPVDVLSEWQITDEIEPYASVEPAELTPRDLDIFQKHKPALPAQRNYTWMLVAAGVIGLVALLAWMKLGPGKDLFAGQAASYSPTMTNSQSKTTEPASESAIPSETPTQVDPAIVTVTVLADSASWLSVTTSDGQSLYRDVMQPGNEYTFTDPMQLQMRIGNAAAVHLVVNGYDLGVPGLDGEVIDRVFGLGDPRAGL